MIDDRRKLLTLEMGECWHELEYDRDEGHYFCKFCGHIPEWPNKMNRTFDNPVDFFALWNWAKEQGWWATFGRYMERRYRDDRDYREDKCSYFVHPDRFPELVVDFLWEKEGRK